MKKTMSLLLVFMAITTSCTNENPSNPTETDKDTANNVTSTENSETEENSHYPVTIENYNSNGETIEMVFNEAPKKVLAVYQSSIETMLALGLSGNIVAASGLDFPVKEEYAEAFEEVNYLTEFMPSKETAVTLEPDMVFSWKSLFQPNTLGNTSTWQENGVNTYIATNSIATVKTLENEYTDLMNIGKIFDKEKEAEEIVNNIKTQVENALEKGKSDETAKSVLVLEAEENNLMVYGKDTLAGDMVTKIGGEIISTESGSINSEELIANDPDIIFTIYYGDSNDTPIAESAVNAIMGNPKYASLSAVKNETVYPISLAEIYCSGVRTADGVNSLAEGIYQD